MSDETKVVKDENQEEYSLNDDRRVKVLSPGMLVAKRFFRNRLAVTGLAILLAMFIFSFIGGLVTPYQQDQKFYRTEAQSKDYAGVLHNEEFRYTVSDSELFTGPVQAQTLLHIMRNEDKFNYNNTDYNLTKVNDEYYTISSGGKLIGIASKALVNSSTSNETFSFDFTYAALNAYAKGAKSFTNDGKKYTIDAERYL